MNRETAKSRIKKEIPCTDILVKGRNPGHKYICPFCHSGEHENGTGGLEYYPETNTFTCFACNKSGDIIDLYQNSMGTSYTETLSLLAESIGITVDEYRPTKNKAHTRTESDETESTQEKTPTDAKKPANAGKIEKNGIEDLTPYFEKCKARINDPEAVSYLKARGISKETAEAYYIGYDPEADPAKTGYKTKRIIIPTSSTHYIARAIDPETPKQYAKMNNKGGTPAIFNAASLYNSDGEPVFITEGAFDALSIIEAGASAIATNSTANIKRLLDLVKEKKPGAPLILCLDNDEAGNKASRALQTELKAQGVSFITADICNGAKDPNDALKANKEAFFEAIEDAKTRAIRPDSAAVYLKTQFEKDKKSFTSKRTGFKNLDRESNGLFTGLYCVAAATSLGKTTFVLQMADQMARAGEDVLYFSLEQNKFEIVSKSISRIMRETAPQTAQTSLEIRRGGDTEATETALKKYTAEIAERMNIIDGIFSVPVSAIKKKTEEYITLTGKTPIVIIDYLQIIQAEPGTHDTDKQKTDAVITALKRLSNEKNITIIAISSINRANYTAPIEFEALKESGNIEFSCDVVYGMQLQCLSQDDIFTKENNITTRRRIIADERAQIPRKIELVCLKNRYGKNRFSCYYEYDPQHDYFKETDTPTYTPQSQRAKNPHRL